MAAEEKGVVAWKRIGLGAGPAVFALLAFAPSSLHRIPGMGHRPAYAAAIACLMAVWWFTEALPIAVTAAVPLVLYPLFGVFGRGPRGDALRTVEPYFDAYIFLFLGGMTLGAAMEQWGLHRRVALIIMRAIGTEPRRLLFGMLVSTAAVSMWISNTATAVMMMPIGMALLTQLEQGQGGRRLGDFGASLMLSIAYASNVGGIGTKIGTGTNSIFVGFLSEKLGYDMSFLRYMAVGLPFVVLFIPIVWWVLWQNAKGDAPTGGQGRAVLDRELAALGAWSTRERLVALVFVGAAVLWIFGDVLRPLVAPVVADLRPGFKLLGKHYEAGVALLAAAVLLLTGTVSRAQLARVPWSTLLLLGGSFALAAGIEGGGLSGFMTQKLEPVARLPLIAQLGLVSVATVGLSAVASNTATVNVLLNVLPRSLPVLSACAIAASCDFALPAGTPPNAIVFGSGYVRLPQMMRIGAVLDALAAALITVYAYFYLRSVL